METVSVKAGAFAQPASFGPYSLNVIEPPGLEPPKSVAVSCTWPPSMIPAEALVVRLGLAFETTTDSPASLQAVETELLFASPEYEVVQRYVPACVAVQLPE